MNVMKNFAGSVTRAVNFVVDKNRMAALINRLKIVIKNEKETQARAYIELGKYYYENLRDPENETTEKFCGAVDEAGRRLKKAFARLDELVAPAPVPTVEDDEPESYDFCDCDEDVYAAPAAAAEAEEDETTAVPRVYPFADVSSPDPEADDDEDPQA